MRVPYLVHKLILIDRQIEHAVFAHISRCFNLAKGGFVVGWRVPWTVQPSFKNKPSRRRIDSSENAGLAESTESLFSLLHEHG